MKISCPACAAKYSIADEKVQDRLAKIRCRKCGTTIVIDGKVNPPSVYAADGAGHADAGHETMADEGGAPAGGAGEYTVDFGENDQRSMSLADLIAAYNSGQVTGETYVWADGFADWTALAQVPQVVDALNAAAAPAPAAASAYSAPTFQQPAAAPRAAAVASTARRGGDLFGGIESAGSEEEVATSAPHDHAHAAAPGVSAAATGARNESSVLFSLSALTSSAKSSKPTQSPAAAVMTAPAKASVSSASVDDDDSGLIDLKALSNAAAAADRPPTDILSAPLMPSPLGAPPLGMAAPLAIDSSIDTSMPQQKSKTGIIAALILAIAAVIIAAMFMLRPASPPPEQPQATPAAPLPTRAAAPDPTQESTAKPPATGTASEDAGAKTAAKKGGTYRRPAKGGGKTAPAADTGGGAAAPAAPKPKRNACGCASGDLQCAMACAAKGG